MTTFAFVVQLICLAALSLMTLFALYRAIEITVYRHRIKKERRDAERFRS